MLRMADRLLEKIEDSLLIGEMSSVLPHGTITKDWQTAWIPLSQLRGRLNQKELANVVFQVAGNGSGRIFVRDLAFTKKKGISISSAKKVQAPACSSNKAMWLWETEKILKNSEEQKTFLEFSKRQHLTDLFMQIPYQAEKEGNKWAITWDSTGMPMLISTSPTAPGTLRARRARWILGGNFRWISLPSPRSRGL